MVQLSQEGACLFVWSMMEHTSEQPPPPPACFPSFARTHRKTCRAEELRLRSVGGVGFSAGQPLSRSILAANAFQCADVRALCSRVCGFLVRW